MKTCFKCGLPKPIGEFYAHPQMADGHLGKCKDCCKLDVKQNYRARKPHYRDYEKQRARLPHRVALRTAYQREHPDVCSPHKKAWELRNPEKKRACTALNNAIRDGKIVRQTICEVCGSAQNVEAHHDDYTKVFDVRWLCKRHHWEADCARREHDAVSFNFGYNVV